MSVDTTLGHGPTADFGGAVVQRRSLKGPLSFAIVTVIILLFVFPLRRDGESTYRLGDRASSIAMPDIALPTGITVTVCALLMVVMTAWAFWRWTQYRPVSLWLVVAFVDGGVLD